MSAEPLPSRYPNLPGFDKRNRELVYAMIDAGWTGRITSKRHFMGKAPDGKTQITVPSKDGNNRGFANAHAQFMRWVKEHVTPEINEVWDAALETDDPILKDILNKIRMLVGQPDQSEEIEALKAENLELANQIVRLKEERATLRDLLTEE